MKKILLFFSLLLVLQVSAKKYIPGEPWPANGYDLRSYAPEFDISVQRFPDNDTLYYLRMNPNGMEYRIDPQKDSFLIGQKIYPLFFAEFNGQGDNQLTGKSAVLCLFGTFNSVP